MPYGGSTVCRYHRASAAAAERVPREGLVGAVGAAALAEATSRPAQEYRCRQPYDSTHLRRAGRIYCPANNDGVSPEAWLARQGER